MSTIERAVKRLELLRREQGQEQPGDAADPAVPDAPTSSIERAVGRRDDATVAPPALDVEEDRLEPRLGDATSIDLVEEPSLSGRTGLEGAHVEPVQAIRGWRHSKQVEIDLAHLKGRGFITPDAPRSKLADEFRIIKRPLIMNAKGRSPTPLANANLIMVTSSLPGEGKSFVSLNLAISIAMEMDSTVLLVDADVGASSLVQTLKLPTTLGLLDVLGEPGLDLGDVLLKTSVTKLTVLPSGTVHQKTTEVLASDAMAHLVREMATRYPDRIVIFDAPPLLAMTESRVLASHMGQIVMVVEANRTTRGALSDALDMIQSCPVVMTVLNKAADSEVGYFYGQYPSFGSYAFPSAGAGGDGQHAAEPNK